MAQIYADYTTLTDLRTNYIGTTSTDQDTLLLQLIQASSREIDRLAHRYFYPSVQTRTFDTPPQSGGPLVLDTDLLEVTTLTNGDGEVLTSTIYALTPNNTWPKYQVILKLTQGRVWQLTSAGERIDAITLLGIWGYHDDYNNAWLSTLGTLQANITNSATSATVTTGTCKRGDLLMIGSEYVYVSAVSTGATDTLTLVRGVNGSTAAAHTSGDVFYRWTQQEIQMLCNEIVTARYRLRNNPIGESINVGGQTFSTPKDVTQYTQKRLQGLGLLRMTLGSSYA